MGPNRKSINSTTQLDRALEKIKTAFPSSPSLPDVRLDQINEASPDFVSWRVAVLEKIDLEQIYGPWLTGRKNGVDWLECRDPESPSGDRDPSAGVAIGTGKSERGRFHSFRENGRTRSLFDFMVDTKQATDFRDALQRVASMTGIPLPKSTYSVGNMSSTESSTTPTPPKPRTDPASVIEEFNKHHAIVTVGANSLILWERYNPETKRHETDYIRKSDFTLFYDNRYVVLKDETGQPKNKQAADFWIHSAQRRTYEQVIFAPGLEDPRYYNLWRGFAFSPSPGDWSLFRAHILENICASDESLYQYIFTWMADAVQNPSDRPGVALVFRGRQGTGKGVFCREFGSLFGQHFIHISQSRHLTGNFNNHLKDCLVLFADEAFWAGDKAGEGALKALITEPDLLIEMKGRDAVRMTNRVRLIIASNSDWIVPAGMEERRFCVIDVGETHMQDHAYFRAISEQMKNGGRAAFLHDLLNHDLSSGTTNLRTIPQTESLFDQKIQSLGSIEQYWYRCLWNGQIFQDEEWPDYYAVPINKVYNQYIDFCQKIGIRHPVSDVKFGKSLKQRLCPSIKTTRPQYTDMINGEDITIRKRSYEFQPLDICRAEFCNAINFDIQWEKDDESSKQSSPSQGPLPF